MPFYLFLLFTVIPLVEVIILVWIGGQTAWWVPLLLVFATGIAGAALARWQGWRSIQRIREETRAGRMPTGAIIDGVLILVAGILLVTPGVLTDLFGLALLTPPLRALLKRGVSAWIRRNFEVRVSRARDAWHDADGAAGSTGDTIIDAKVFGTRVEDAK